MGPDSPVKVGTVTADNPIVATRGWYLGARIVGDGTNAAAVTIYDNASAASGTVIDALRCASTGSEGHQFDYPVRCDNGIYCDVTTVGRVVVWYQS